MKQVLILLSIFILWGCSNTSEPAPQEIPDVDQTNSIIPLRVGNHWEYSATPSPSRLIIKDILHIFPKYITKKIQWMNKTLYSGDIFDYTIYNSTIEIYHANFNATPPFCNLIYTIPLYIEEDYEYLITRSHKESKIYLQYKGFDETEQAEKYVFYTKFNYSPYEVMESADVFIKRNIGLHKIVNRKYVWEAIKLIDYKVNP